MLNDKPEIKIKLNGNKLYVECVTASPEYTYQFCLIRKDGVHIEYTPFTPSPHVVYWLTDPGVYKAQVTILDGDQDKTHGRSSDVEFGGLLNNVKLKEDNKRSAAYVFLRSIYRVTKEIWKNKTRMLRVASYDKKVENKDSYLGRIWDVLNPLLQICVFWFVFSTVRAGRDAVVNGFEYPFLLWMLCGFIPWLFINAGITKGAASVFWKSSTVLKAKYPLSTIPVGSIFVLLYEHITNLGILVILFAIHGVFPNLYWLNLLYYILYMVLFLSALSLVTSTFTMLARDFQKLLNTIVRLLFFITPIMFEIGDNFTGWAARIFNMNPILYIVKGFRSSLLGYENFYEYDIRKIVFFWVLLFVIYALGCNLQQRFKDKFVDLI